MKYKVEISLVVLFLVGMLALVGYAIVQSVMIFGG